MFPCSFPMQSVFSAIINGQNRKTGGCVLNSFHFRVKPQYIVVLSPFGRNVYYNSPILHKLQGLFRKNQFFWHSVYSYFIFFLYPYLVYLFLHLAHDSPFSWIDALFLLPYFESLHIPIIKQNLSVFPYFVFSFSMKWKPAPSRFAACPHKVKQTANNHVSLFGKMCLPTFGKKGAWLSHEYLSTQ